MNNYDVSILIPVYNSERFIEKCAESVFLQTFQNIEYIFVDDASTDCSIDKLWNVLDKFPERKTHVKIIRNEINEGISNSRQKAFDAANGVYFLAMDSDDWIESNMIELLYNKAIEVKADIVYCSYYEDFEDGSKIFPIDFKAEKSVLIENVLKGHSAYWNKLILKNLLDKNKITTLKGVDMADDLVVLVKLIYYANSFACVDKPLYHYVQYNSNAITKKYKPKHIEDNLKVIEELESFLKEKPDFTIYENIFLHFKALRKIKIVRYSFADRRYLKLFPEIKSKIGELNLPLKSKIILWLSAHHLFKSSKVFLNFLKVANEITKKS